MSIPEDNDYHTIAKWLTREPEIFDMLKARLGQEHITKHAEVEDEEVFLKTCTKCKIPAILHMIVRDSEEEDPKCNELISRVVNNYQIPLQDNAQIETFNELFDIEIRTLVMESKGYSSARALVSVGLGGTSRREYREMRLVAYPAHRYLQLDVRVLKPSDCWAIDDEFP